MPEAVIVATARSPIGRAFKGSLKEMRPDDLTLQMVQAVLAKVPALDPREIDDLMLGCGQPAAESGFNMARIVAVLAGLDHLPGTTVNRYCSSSLQTRAAGHAEPGLRRGQGPVGDLRRRRPDLGRPEDVRAAPRRLHRDGPDRGEPRPVQGSHPRRPGRVRRPQPEPRREGDR
jgi:hypothetical protein